MQLTLIPHLFSHLFLQKDMCICRFLFWYVKAICVCILVFIPSVYEVSCVLRAETIPFGVGWQLLREVAQSGFCGRSHSYYCSDSSHIQRLTRAVSAIRLSPNWFKTDIPYWLLKILTPWLIVCDLSTDRVRTGCLIGLWLYPMMGTSPALTPIPRYCSQDPVG